MPRGARRLPEACLEQLRASDLIVHLGDFSEREVLDSLESLGPPVAAVHGNVDSAELCSQLPDELLVEAFGHRIALVHDAGPAAGRIGRMRRRFPDAEAVLFGHSHLPLVEREGGFAIFNPGSPTERRRAPVRSMGIVEAGSEGLDFKHLSFDGAPLP